MNTVTALDRYHGPGGAPRERPQVRLASPKPSVALPAPPLAIAHVAAPKLKRRRWMQATSPQPASPSGWARQNSVSQPNKWT